MSGQNVSLHVHKQDVSLADLESVAVGLSKILGGLGVEKVKLTELSLSSIKVGSLVEQDDAAQRLDSLATGTRELVESSIIPDGWTKQTVDGFALLGKVLGDDGASLTIGDHPPIMLGRSIAQNATTATRIFGKSFGSGQGRIHRWVDDRKREVSLRDEATGKSVSITFPKSMQERVASLVGKRVMFSGVLARNAAGQKVSLKAEDLIELPAEVEAVTIDDLVGSLGPDWTDGMSSVDWVRSQRGG